VIAQRRWPDYAFVMPNLKVAVPHQLTQEEAKNRVSKLIADSRAKFGDKVSGLEESWAENIDTFRFNAMGFAVDGQLDVQPSQVVVDINLPWAAFAFKSRLESEIIKHARELLA
jgi:hypothetical protein